MATSQLGQPGQIEKETETNALLHEMTKKKTHRKSNLIISSSCIYEMNE